MPEDVVLLTYALNPLRFPHTFRNFEFFFFGFPGRVFCAHLSLIVFDPCGSVGPQQA
jgi:hypothetical protein